MGAPLPVPGLYPASASRFIQETRPASEHTAEARRLSVGDERMPVSSRQTLRRGRLGSLGTWNAIAVPLVLMLYVAWYQVIFDSRDRLSASDAVFAALFVSVWLGAAVWAILRESSLLAAIGFSVYSIAFLIGLFASLYLGSGSPNDWSRRLSQLDAVTLALGTFTTAGTFGVTPVSQTARGLVTLQMGIDLVATLVIFGLLAARLTELRRTRVLSAAGDG